MPGGFFITDSGTPKIVSENLIQAGQKTREMKPVMESIFLDMLVGNYKQIDSAGHRGSGMGGGSYAQLAPMTLIKKGSAEMLFTTGARPGYKKIAGDDLLVRSVTQLGKKYQIRRVTATGVELGTKRPHARSHQYGNASRKIPARPFMSVLNSDIDRWKGWIAAKLMEGLEAR